MALVVCGPLSAGRKSPEEHLAEGNAAHRLGHHRRAIQSFKKAKPGLDHPFPALAGLARAEGALGEFENAHAALDEAAEVAMSGEERAAAWNLRGITYSTEAQELADGRKRKKTGSRRDQLLSMAIEAYQKALSAAPSPPPAIWANMAVAQSRALHRRAARESVETFLKLEPSGAASVAGLVHHLDCLDRLEASIDFEHAATRSPEAVLEPPTRVFFPAPSPTGSRDNGSAHFETVIDTEGVPHCTRVTKNFGLSGEFIQGALQTLFTWRFTPALLDGEPVTATYRLTVSVRSGG